MYHTVCMCTNMRQSHPDALASGYLHEDYELGAAYKLNLTASGSVEFSVTVAFREFSRRPA
jgi:hypothetical protein